MAHYVYRCYDADGRLIYVGMAKNVFERMEVHRATSWWAPQVAKVRGRVCKDLATARIVELAAIRAEGPRWNVWGRWSARAGWSKQDYIDFAEALRHTEAAWGIRGNRWQHERVFRVYQQTFGEEHPLASTIRANRVPVTALTEGVA